MTNNKPNFSSSHANTILGYTVPKLHTGKKWFVDFFCIDPLTNTMRRKKYHIDNVVGKVERKRYAADLIANLYARLQKGWNVWADATTNREYTMLTHVFDYYEKYISRQKDTGALRMKSYQSYASFTKQFRIWCEAPEHHLQPLVYAYQISRQTVIEFLEYMYIDREVSARTRNNYKTWLFTFCSFMVERGYLGKNPVEDIKNIREDAKHRDPLTASQLAQMRRYLEEHGEQHFLLACMMEYYTFIRPEELTCLKVGDIHLKEQKVVTHGEWTKNRRDEAVGLNQELIRMMIDLDIFSHPSQEFLFGTKDFRPSPTKQSGRIFRERFIKMRKALKWPDSIQFYSLKDTGIRDLANAEGIVIARDQARHTDVATTNRYLKGDSLSVHEETKRFKGNL